MEVERYGLQLCTNVRIDSTEKQNGNIKSLQIAQNKLMRLLINAPYKDRTSTEELLEKTGLLSINQLAASIKLCEVWKSENIDKYPVQLEPNNLYNSPNERVVRPATNRKWNQDAKTTAAKESFSRNAAKIWNASPQCVKEAISLRVAKAEIKKYCKLLPV